MPDQAKGLLSPFLRRKRISAVRPYLCGRVLDVGCGTGLLSESAANGLYVGLDIDEESISIARRRYPGIRFETAYPEGEYFDTVVLLAVIEHVDNPAEFLKQITYLLAPAGRIILTTPHPIIGGFYSIGAKAGIFGTEAHHEHKTLLNYAQMDKIIAKAGLSIFCYKRFLFGSNQLFVIKKGK